MCQRDLGVPFVSFNARTGHRSSAPEDCGRFVVTLPQGPVPVSGVFPAGVLLHLLETGIQAIQLSPYHADPPARRSRTPGHDRRFPGMLFSPFTFRITGQPSDPETSPLVPARYASDTTLRLVAQLQHAPTAPTLDQRPPHAHSPPRRDRPTARRTGSVVLCTSTCRSRDVTEFRHPQARSQCPAPSRPRTHSSCTSVCHPPTAAAAGPGPGPAPRLAPDSASLCALCRVLGWARCVVRVSPSRSGCSGGVGIGVGMPAWCRVRPGRRWLRPHPRPGCGQPGGAGPAGVAPPGRCRVGAVVTT